METHSIVAVPVRFRDHCLGVIELVNCVGVEGFHDRDLALLEALADFAAIALENARHVQRIHELTITDDCTSLYNARHLNFILETEIYRSQRYGYEFSLVFPGPGSLQVRQRHARPPGGLQAAGGDRQRAASELPPDRFRVPLRRRRVCDLAAANLQGKRLRRGAALAQADPRDRTGCAPKVSTCTSPPAPESPAYPTDAKTKAELLHLADEAMYLVKNTTRDSVAAAHEGLLSAP